MKAIARRFLLLSALSVLALARESPVGCQIPAPGQDASASGASRTGAAGAIDAESWPREVKSGETVFRIHQPQFESWDGGRLEAYAAAEVRTGGNDSALYGVIRIAAHTSVDKVNRMVALEGIQIPGAKFPSARNNEGSYLRILQNSLVKTEQQISLDRFEAALAIMEAGHRVAAFPLRNDPPRIIFSAKPAVLVYIDGNPAYRLMKEAKLERVINTRPLIVKDSKGRHYLRLFDGWMESGVISGPWTVCKKPPRELEVARLDAVAGGQVDLLEGKADPEKKAEKPSLKKKPVPIPYISTTPAELLVTDGDPRFVPIEGTSLSYAENTTGNLFRHATEQKTYVLISGRWFRSASPEGPWEFVPGGNLPPDFANIPDDSPKENAKASVPGTAQAMEAVIANSIPQMATVNRKTAKINPPQFDGEPVFKPIEGASLHYAANTSTPIIRAGARAYYAVENGVWFQSPSIKGPWEVADSIPAAVYSIPPDSPMHFVSYVRIYGSGADTVTVGYTPGYYGICTTRGSGYVIVYGTGYPYTPWVGSVWYGPPVTYGFGSAVCYTPWTGWTYSYGFGWSWGYPMYPMGWGWGPYPWWGPVGWVYYYPYPYYRPPYYYAGVAWGPAGAVAWGPGAWAATTGNIYYRWDSAAAVTRTSGGFNAWTGNRWASQVGMAYNSTTGNLAAGQRAAIGNVYTGNYAYGKRGFVTDTDTGRTIGGGKITAGNARTGESGSMGWIRGENAGMARIGDDIYAGKDGTVYRKGENGWEKNSGGGWDRVERPPAAGQQRAGASRDPNPAGEASSKKPSQNADRSQLSNLQTGRLDSGRQLSSQETLRALELQRAARSAGEMRTRGYRSGAYRRGTRRR